MRLLALSKATSQGPERPLGVMYCNTSPSAAYTSDDIIGIAEYNINAIRNKGRIFLERFNNF